MSSPQKILLSLCTILTGLSIVTACTRNKDGASSASAQKTSGEVHLAIWGNYLSPEARERFTKQTGVRLTVTNYSSNEELLAKLQTGASGLDVAVPSDYMVDVMMKLALLEALDKTKISHAKDVSPEALGEVYDAKNEFSLPYAFSITGIAVNRDLYKEPITSWKDLLDNPKLAGKIALLDDVREVAGAALKMGGHSINSTDAGDLAQARDLLLKVRPNVKMFTSDTIDILKNKEVAAAQTYSMDALQASAATDGKIEFIIPSEGSSRGTDNLVIVKGSKNIEAAHKLIDFLLAPENNLEFVKAIRAGPVVQGVREKLPPDLKSSAILFPSKEVMGKLERLQDLGEKNRLYEDLWTKVKTAR